MEILNFICNLWQNCFRGVEDVKMSSFSITRKKTPFQKHREEEEAKKKVFEFHSLSVYIIQIITMCTRKVV